MGGSTVGSGTGTIPLLVVRASPTREQQDIINKALNYLEEKDKALATNGIKSILTSLTATPQKKNTFIKNLGQYANAQQIKNFLLCKLAELNNQAYNSTASVTKEPPPSTISPPSLRPPLLQKSNESTSLLNAANTRLKALDDLSKHLALPEQQGIRTQANEPQITALRKKIKQSLSETSRIINQTRSAPTPLAIEKIKSAITEIKQAIAEADALLQSMAQQSAQQTCNTSPSKATEMSFQQELKKVLALRNKTIALRNIRTKLNDVCGLPENTNLKTIEKLANRHIELMRGNIDDKPAVWGNEATLQILATHHFGRDIHVYSPGVEQPNIIKPTQPELKDGNSLPPLKLNFDPIKQHYTSLKHSDKIIPDNGGCMFAALLWETGVYSENTHPEIIQKATAELRNITAGKLQESFFNNTELLANHLAAEIANMSHDRSITSFNSRYGDIIPFDKFCEGNTDPVTKQLLALSSAIAGNIAKITESFNGNNETFNPDYVTKISENFLNHIGNRQNVAATGPAANGTTLQILADITQRDIKIIAHNNDPYQDNGASTLVQHHQHESATAQAAATQADKGPLAIYYNTETKRYYVPEAAASTNSTAGTDIFSALTQARISEVTLQKAVQNNQSNSPTTNNPKNISDAADVLHEKFISRLCRSLEGGTGTYFTRALEEYVSSQQHNQQNARAADTPFFQVVPQQ